MRHLTNLLSIVAIIAVMGLSLSALKTNKVDYSQGVKTFCTDLCK